MNGRLDGNGKTAVFAAEAAEGAEADAGNDGAGNR
jgi:hypothetical protein